MVEGVRRIPFTFYDGIVMQIHAAPFKIKLKSFLNFFLLDLPSYLCFRAKCDVMTLIESGDHKFSDQLRCLQKGKREKKKKEKDIAH